jgi:uncharacterized protein (TIGR02099 family)
MVLRKVAKVLLFSIAGFLSLILLVALAVKLALDRAPQYQAEIKDWVHNRIGYHIAFAHVSPAFRWYGPELYFDRLELRSKDDQRVLARAAGGRVGADIWQLIRSGKLFAGRIELDSPNISVTRVSPDRFALASEIDIGGGNSSLPTLRLDDLPAGTLAIRHGLIAVQNWNPALPQLELRDVNLNLRRGDGGAWLAITARLPTVLGGVLSVNGAAQGLGQLNSLSWTALARAGDLSLAGWRQLLPEFLSRLGSGTGGFEVAARGLGPNLTRADLEFGADNVVTQLTAEPGVKFDQITGGLTITHIGDRWTLLGRHVLALRAGRRDPDSDFDVSWRGDDLGLLELRARANYLRAETLLPLAGLLPQKDLRERIQEIAPTGEWMDTHVDLMRAAVSDPWRLNVQARFRGVGFAPAGRAPGLRGLNGTLAGNDGGGRIDIETQKGVFTWPSEFSQPVDVDNFHTTLYWKRTPDELLVATPSIELETRDAAFHGRVAWQQPSDGGSPVLTVAGSVENGNVANTRWYLPRLLIAPAALTWLNRAFLAGHLSHADVVIQGPVRHFPFRDGTGLFLARAHIDGLMLDYKDGWPIGENLALVAEFRNEGMSVQLASGHIGRLTVDGGDARFADFKAAELQLHAAVSGDAADALGYLRATPLDALAEHVFSSVEARGPVQTDVDLFMPFKEFDHRRSLVHAHLHGVSLNRTGSTLAATELTGDADIDDAQVSHADVHGKILGGSFQMQARAPRNRPVTRTILVFNGNFSGDALHSALSLPASIPTNGTADWHGVLRMAPEPARERSLRISGSLAGLELNLPEPLAKPAGRPLPSSVEIQWPASGGPQIRLSLGSVLRGQLTLDSDVNGPTLGRAAVTFGSSSADPPTFSDSQIVNTGGTIDRLDLAGWLKLYTPDKNAKPLGNFLRTAKFDVAQIDYLGLSFLDVALDLALTDAGWRIGIGGPNVVGSITLPSAASSTTPWELQFDRLKFVDGPGAVTPGVAAPTEPTADVAAHQSEANPRGIPAINFHAAAMIWGEREFGDVRATLAKLDDGISLKELTVTAPSFSASAKGEWRGPGAGMGRIEGTLSSSDVGNTLKELGYDAVIEAKTGKMDFDMSWAGAPTGDALSLATGHVQVALDKGQITGLKPGAGRVVGLASLAALPRRLALDFSDLTDKGLAFDTIRGDFDLHDGSAFTDNVLVNGPAAEIGLIGRVGLKNKDYDQTAVVTGNVNSSLPLAAFAAGPVIGGAVLLFTQVFKQPLKGLTRGYYRITGSWDNPTVERIKSAGAAAATAEAPK